MKSIAMVNGDLSTVQADLLLVPTDAEVEGHYGRTCRAALRRTGLEQAPYGFGNGNHRLVRTGPCAPDLMFIGTISDTAQEGYARSALMGALAEASKRGYTRVASPLLTGGWRIRPVDAAALMAGVMDSLMVCGSVKLCIVENDSERYEEARSVLRGLGW